MSGTIQLAFDAICKDAKAPTGIYLSLYSARPFYGGPEEGGWWGNDYVLEASQAFSFEEDAEHARADIEKLAEKLSTTARMDFGQQCLDEIEWCEERGLEHETFLREPDGPWRYFVVLEARRGSMEHNDCRHYE